MKFAGVHSVKLSSGRICFPVYMMEMLGSEPVITEKIELDRYPFLEVRSGGNLDNDCPVRIGLSKSYRDHIDVLPDDEVLVVGRNAVAEIWNPKTYEDYETDFDRFVSENEGEPIDDN